jgi:hypothetical protein
MTLAASHAGMRADDVLTDALREIVSDAGSSEP